MSEQLFKGSAVFIFGENEISVEFTGDKNPFERVKPTLDTIIKEGQLNIHNAVEKVITKHEKEVMEVEIKIAADKKAASMPSQEDYNKRRMASLSGSSDWYLDRLLMAQNRSLGVGCGYGLAGSQNTSLSSGLLGGWS